MHRPALLRFSGVISLLTAMAVVLFAAQVLAVDGRVEKEAKDLQKKAIEQDNLNVDYDAAQKKLNTAIQKCGADKCSPGLKGSLYRDLGAMQILAGSTDDGAASFEQALKLDGSLQLDPAYKTPALQGIWDQARKKVGATGAPPPTGTGTAPPPSGGGAISGDFTHEPVTDQTIRTPIPVYVEYSGSEQLKRVIVKYKGNGMTEFKALELKKMGTGYGGEIPCTDVLEGQLQYYFQGFNDQDDPVANLGERNRAFKVNVTKTIEGAAPHLPGKPPPKACKDTSDCPEGPAGAVCRGEAPGAETSEGKGEGEDCQEDNECKSGQCKDEKCTAPTEEEGEGKPKKFRRFWIGLLGSLDFVSLGSDSDVCLRSPDGSSPVNSTGYDCVDPNGNDFPSNLGDNTLIKKGSSDQVKGGFAPGNFRIMLSADYALTTNLLVGARIGYVARTYPGGSGSNPYTEGKGLSIPGHFEGRVTYLIGKDAIMQPLVPYVFLGGGVAEWSSSVSVTVNSNNGTPFSAASGNQPSGFTAGSWLVGGPGFASLGGGGRLLVGNAALTAALKVTGAFGGVGLLFPIVSPEIGAQIGF
jgi:hypothetical protein